MAKTILITATITLVTLTAVIMVNKARVKANKKSLFA